jgi:hypothetical protein
MAWLAVTAVDPVWLHGDTLCLRQDDYGNAMLLGAFILPLARWATTLTNLLLVGAWLYVACGEALPGGGLKIELKISTETLPEAGYARLFGWRPIESRAESGRRPTRSCPRLWKGRQRTSRQVLSYDGINVRFWRAT